MMAQAVPAALRALLPRAPLLLVTFWQTPLPLSVLITFLVETPSSPKMTSFMNSPYGNDVADDG